MRVTTRWVRCLHPLAISHLGLGVVPGMHAPLCHGLVKDSPEDMQEHATCVHGVGHVQWSEPILDEQSNEGRRERCECGRVRPDDMSKCITCAKAEYVGDAMRSKRRIDFRRPSRRRKFV
jgi:hypothetical protein